MTTVRSSLPSRIRQLLSADGALGPSIKLDSEPVSSIALLVLFDFACLYSAKLLSKEFSTLFCYSALKIRVSLEPLGLLIGKSQLGFCGLHSI